MAAENSPTATGFAETIAWLVFVAWTVKPLPPVTEPSYDAPVAAPIEAVGTETPAATGPRLPTSAVAFAVMPLIASIVDVPVTPAIEALDAAPDVTWASPLTVATAAEPARPTPRRLTLTAIVWASASRMPFAFTSTELPPVM